MPGMMPRREVVPGKRIAPLGQSVWRGRRRTGMMRAETRRSASSATTFWRQPGSTTGAAALYAEDDLFVGSGNFSRSRG